MTAPRRPADRAARLRATTDFETNLVVSAAAGTGKTSLLVERILNAVGSGRVRLEEMAAVTFTRKAAAEMRSRLEQALGGLRALALEADAPGESGPGPGAMGVPAAVRQARSEKGGGEAPGASEEALRSWDWLRGTAGLPAPEVARRALEALESLDAFDVSTIHAFCGRILKSYPVEAGVDPSFREDEGTAFEDLFRRQWPRFLEAELGGEGGRELLWREALRRFSMEDLRQAARLLVDFGMPRPDEWREQCSDPVAALGPIARRIAEGAASILAAGGPFAPSFRALLELERELAEAFLEGRWRGGEPLPIPEDTAARLHRSVPEPGSKVEARLAREAQKFAREARHRLRALARLDEAAARAMVDPLRPFVSRFREEYLGAGWISFDGLLRKTLDLLREHAGVRRILQRRYRHLLVDEFQDTSPVQYEILFLLAEAAEAGPADDPWEARLAPGRLFIVGDPKQSIYRFQQADIAAYRRAVEKIRAGGGAVLRLNASFRSVPALAEAVNRLFGAEFPAADGDYQPAYEPMQAMREAQEGPPVEIWSSGAAAPAAAERREAEARAIAAWIVEHAIDRREFDLREIAILLRSMTGVGVYVDALRDAGVPLVVEGGREFLERPEVRRLRALLSTLARPHDPVPLLAVLRSALGGVSDRELLEQTRSGGGWSLTDPDRPGSPPALRRALAWLRGLRAELEPLPPEEQARLALERSGLDLVEASRPDGARSFANLRRYAQAVADASRQGGLTLEQALEAVEAAAEPRRAGVEESPLADETLEAVRILTVHKAKGLEFDAVIVADTCRGEPNSGDGAVRIDRPRAGAAGLAVRTRRFTNVWGVLHEHEEGLHERAEAMRILYVACTRARRRLIVVGGPAREADAERPWPAALRHWSYDAGSVPPDWAALAPGVVHRRTQDWAPRFVEAPASPGVGDGVARFVEASRRATSEGGVRERSPSGLVEIEWARTEGREEPAPRAPAAPAAVLGRTIHRALERWDGRGDGRVALAGALRAEALAGGVEERDLAARAAPLWQAVLASTLPELLRSGRVAGREVPILLEEGGAVWIGSIDLLYRDAGGEWVILDYKTEDPGTDLPASARRHAPQLGVYVRAAQRALGSRPRAEIFWVRTGVRTAVDPGPLDPPPTSTPAGDPARR